jgi:hypothetical protein
MIVLISKIAGNAGSRGSLLIETPLGCLDASSLNTGSGGGT